jgi:hypothetical protein
MAGMNPYETLLDFLPAEKQNALMEHEQSFAAKMMKRLKDAQNNPEVMREIMKEKDAELAKVLTPQEKEEYDLRMSQTAMMMRMQMSEFQPNEQEFRDIFKLRKDFENEYGMLGMQSNKPEDRANVTLRRRTSTRTSRTSSAMTVIANTSTTRTFRAAASRTS